MPVTELAILRLPDTLTTANQPAASLPIPSQLLHDLDAAKVAMQSYSGFPFFYFRCLEDPSMVYIIGTWPSVEFHTTKWLPSAENQALLQLLQGRVGVDAMFHVDVDRDINPIPTDAEVLAIGRHFVPADQRAGFDRAFGSGRKYLDEFAGGRDNVVGGWCIDGLEGGQEEFVLFTGWEAQERHMAFAQTDGFAEYAKIKEFCGLGEEIKHAVLLRTDGA